MEGFCYLFKRLETSPLNSPLMDPDGSRPPGQVRQVALVAAMHGGRGHGTAWAGGGRGCPRKLEPHRRILNGNIQETDSPSGWEERTDQCLKFNGHNPL
jgi:hypothetical protein